MTREVALAQINMALQDPVGFDRMDLENILDALGYSSKVLGNQHVWFRRFPRIGAVIHVVQIWRVVPAAVMAAVARQLLEYE